MGKFDPIIEKYRNKGVSAENIEYAIDSVKDGTKREHILESLTAFYRGMNAEDATSLLEELFAANGGEFKKENRSGYWYGAIFLSLGLACAYYIFHVYTYGGILRRPILFFLLAIGGTFSGIVFIVAALFGKFRDTYEDPFQE
jgi:hypothetical protein